MSLPEWDGHATDRETLEVIAALIRLTKPGVVVEAGTYRGHGALYMAIALKKNGLGHLVTCDVVDHGAMGLLEAYDNAEFWHGDYVDLLRKDSTPPIDFAFVDASGDGPAGAGLRWVHFRETLGRLTPGGIICVHDTATDDWDDGEGGASVRRIRETCDLTLMCGRGLSIYQHL